MCSESKAGLVWFGFVSPGEIAYLYTLKKKKKKAFLPQLDAKI